MVLLCGGGFMACDNCDDAKQFTADLYPAVQRTTYDWERVSHVSGDVVYFGVGTEYTRCDASGEEALRTDPRSFYADRDIVFEGETIAARTNLLSEPDLRDHVICREDSDAFFNSPQYLIQMKRQKLDLKGYYTFYFRGVTISGVEIRDSTIVYIQ